MKSIAGSLILVSAVVLMIALAVATALRPKAVPHYSGDYMSSYSTFTNKRLIRSMPCAEKQVDEVEVLLAASRHDTAGAVGLMARHDIPMLDEGTIVDGTIEGNDNARVLAHVTVRSGYYLGTSCWVYSQWVR